MFELKINDERVSAADVAERRDLAGFAVAQLELRIVISGARYRELADLSAIEQDSRIEVHPGLTPFLAIIGTLT